MLAVFTEIQAPGTMGISVLNKRGKNNLIFMAPLMVYKCVELPVLNLVWQCALLWKCIKQNLLISC